MRILILGGTRSERLQRANAAVASPQTVVTIDPRAMPFTRPSIGALATDAPRALRVDDVELAFPNNQSGGMRLVLTQSLYTMQAWLDSLRFEDDVILTAERSALQMNAPEAFGARGPWRLFEVSADSRTSLVPPPISTHAVDPAASLLASAYALPDAIERLARCQSTAEIHPESASAWLAVASSAREAGHVVVARDALDRAVVLASDWAAVHYEEGKFWIGADDMERAAAAFARAGELMPTFSSAFSNLGAALGELDRPGAALAAFGRALDHDPSGFQILNNIGVVTRELGRLAESEAALRRVIELAPEFVFGHYNLGHTLFLAGRYADAVAAYEEGQRRDPSRNVRQACRLAMVRLAAGDVDGAERDFWPLLSSASTGEREELLRETLDTGRALMAAHSSLSASGQPFVDRIADALGM